MPPKKPRKPSRKPRRKRNPPRPPPTILAQARRSTLDRNLGADKARKYPKFVVLPVCHEPYEQNCLGKEPLPPGYTFVPKGDVYVTRHCRSKTKETQQIVYVVFNNAGKRTTGLRIPSDIYKSVLHSSTETASSRANAVHLRDKKDLSHSRQLLTTEFPLMPADSLDTILHHAFLKGSGRVGRTATKSDERKADLAVEAHIRHTHTSYDELLDAGMDRREAREAVRETVKSIKAGWEGSGNESKPLTLPVITIE